MSFQASWRIFHEKHTQSLISMNSPNLSFSVIIEDLPKKSNITAPYNTRFRVQANSANFSPNS